GHRRVEPDLHEELLAAARERLNEVAVDAGQEAVGHLDERHLAAECGVDLAELETDVAPADDEEALGHVGGLERRGRAPHTRARLPTTRSAFHLRRASSAIRGSPKSTPKSLARSTSPRTAATWRSAFDGMHPSQRQAPPRRWLASTTTVSRPSSAQRNAAE